MCSGRLPSVVLIIFFRMSLVVRAPAAQQKKKQRIALALRIEGFAKLAQTCSFCRSLSRTCFVELSLSKRCSECVRAKHACDTAGPRKVRSGPVCRFIWGRTVPPRPPPTPPPEVALGAPFEAPLDFPAEFPLEPPFVDVPSVEVPPGDFPMEWSPGLDLDAFLSSFVPEDLAVDLGSPSFWAELSDLASTAGPGPGSSDLP